MANNAHAAVQVSPNFTVPNLMQTVEARAAYVLGASDDITTLDMPYALAVILGGLIFMYDATDMVSAHDGISVLVSNDGKRFKSDIAGTRLEHVDDRIATPPGSPASGDAYIITSPATGVWAGREDDIALYTHAGWVYITPEVGFHIFVYDELGFYHVTTDGSWVSGLGALQATDGSLSIAALDFPMGIAVEDEQNAPPGSPVDDTAYIVGTSPTGDWASQNQKIALRRSGVWVFIDTYEGALVYDRNASDFKRFDGSNWGVAFTPGRLVACKEVFNSGTVSGVSGWDQPHGSYGSGAPDNTEGAVVAEFTHAVADADHMLYFDVSIFVSLASADDAAFCSVLIDSQTVAADWATTYVEGDLTLPSVHLQATLRVDPSDASSHDYDIRAGAVRASSASAADVTRIKVQLREVKLSS